MVQKENNLMKKLFGVEMEFNFTADEDVMKGLGKGISKGAISLADIINAVKPEIVKKLKEKILKEDKKGE